MPLNLQVKLLRVLEEKKLYRLGGVKEIPIDIRIICATNRDLKKAVENKTFRLDLYYRISIGNIKIPPLHARQEAILPFAHRFASRAFARHGKVFNHFSPEAEKFLKQYQWPGNVRQIKNSMERLALFNSGGSIDLQDLAFIDDVGSGRSTVLRDANEQASIDEFALPDQGLNLEELNCKIVSMTLKKFSGNQTKTASYLGITRRMLQGRMKKWDL